jgi:hypothetical protein
VKRLLALLVVVAAGIVVASVAVTSDAATVNGTGISQSSLNSQLSTIASNSGYQCYLDAQIAADSQGQVQGFTYGGVGGDLSSGQNGTYNNTFVRYWLGQQVSAEVIAQMVSARGLSPTPSELVAARKEVTSSIDDTFVEVESLGLQPACQTTGAAVLGSLPSSFASDLVHQQANVDLLEASAAGYGLSASEQARFFADHPERFAEICLSDIAASTQDEATALRSQVLAGAAFADVAKASSIDTQTAPGGGAAGCFSPTTQGYQQIAQDVAGVPVGGLSKVTQGQNGYFFLQVTSRTPASAEQAQPAIRPTMLMAGRQAATALVRSEAHRSAISVDPRYGTWTTLRGIIAPPRPPANSVLAPLVNVPAVSPAAAAGSGGTG